MRAAPYQLRQSSATLLLNAGAPVLTVQATLGYQHVDTTLGYPRLYDGTVAADYYRAMAEVESRLATSDPLADARPSLVQVLALVDVLFAGIFDEGQRELVQALCAAISVNLGFAVRSTYPLIALLPSDSSFR